MRRARMKLTPILGESSTCLTSHGFSGGVRTKYKQRLGPGSLDVDGPPSLLLINLECPALLNSCFDRNCDSRSGRWQDGRSIRLSRCEPSLPAPRLRRRLVAMVDHSPRSPGRRDSPENAEDIFQCFCRTSAWERTSQSRSVLFQAACRCPERERFRAPVPQNSQGLGRSLLIREGTGGFDSYISIYSQTAKKAGALTLFIPVAKTRICI
jgi:hypothetical protein